MSYQLIEGDCIEWLQRREPNSIHAVVTDPPYVLKEYSAAEQKKLRERKGGVWRLPPAFDGCARMPVPRFTVLNPSERLEISMFFLSLAQVLLPVVVPGGHVFIASNPLVSQLVWHSFELAGWEKRGEIVRLVQTLRGGDRPKNAEDAFPDVSVMPRSKWEPWGLWRKPIEGRVEDNLRRWGTGGLRRISDDQPFSDVIRSAPTHKNERCLAPHPSLKPQAFLRQLVRASLPLGSGVVLDPFAGSGSTLAAAEAVGYESIGIELDKNYAAMARKAIPLLAAYNPGGSHGEESDSDTV